MIFRLGVTGGIGSGKSTVCKTFAVLGVPVFSADEAGREIMDTDPGLRHELNIMVGEDLYATGELDRTKLASIIFNDIHMLQRVNRLVHPYVYEMYKQWYESQDADYVIFEAAILLEAGAEKKVDRVLAVTAPLEERISRVMERNNMSRQQVMERVKNQISDEEMIERSDFHINNSDKAMIIPEIIIIHKSILDYLKS
ncbi:MAG: dephospho-CoA kinase [Bacteroidales bacterium]|nr:dephospho-CoA kinase [Bacteroidales bacterium]